MRAVVQLVKQASVTVEQEVIGRIEQGLLILLGVEANDTKEDIAWLAKKIAQVRIFADNEGKMNQSVQDVDGEVLVVSQFTLFASTKKGNRPSFLRSAQPAIAEPLYQQFIAEMQNHISKPIQTGQFGAMMEVHFINNGPVTLIYDTKNRE